MKTKVNHQKEAIKSYKSLDKQIKKLSNIKEIEKIIERIRIVNGWTTPAEFRFNQSVIESIGLRIDLLVRDIKAFTKAAVKIEVR
jgi:hypothetical protein